MRPSSLEDYLSCWTRHAHGKLMHVELFPLRDPGHHLAGLPPDQSVRVTRLLHACRTHITDAAVGLDLHCRAASRARSLRDSPREAAWDARRHALELEVLATLSAMSAEDRAAVAGQRMLDAAWQVMMERAAVGEMPRDYAFRLPFIHAHTVVYGLDGVEKTLGVLAREQPALPPGVSEAHAVMLRQLPTVKPVRDSAHHLEDRVRGLGRNGQPLPTQPTNTDLFNAPEGALLLGSLFNNKLGFTGSDGAFHEVEICAATIHIAREAVQQVLDALTWEGPPRIFPFW